MTQAKRAELPNDYFYFPSFYLFQVFRGGNQSGTFLYREERESWREFSDSLKMTKAKFGLVWLFSHDTKH